MRYNEVWQFGEQDRSGSKDIHWAFKVRTSDQQSWRPESALEIRATAPTGGIDWSTDEERPVFFNVGLDYYLSDNVVLDVHAGTGLNADAEDLFFGMGGAFRF